MNVLIDVRMTGAAAWHYVFKSLGDSPHLWNPAAETAFDVFDWVRPTLYLGHLAGVDRALKKCLVKSQATAVLYVSLHRNEDNGLVFYEQERQVLEELTSENAIFYLVSPISSKGLEENHETHHVFSLPYGADIRSMAAADPLYTCDMAVFGELKHNEQGFARHVLPIVKRPFTNDGVFQLHIYGNGTWRIPNDVGHVGDSELGPACASAGCVPVISADVCYELPYLFFQACLSCGWVGTDSKDIDWLDLGEPGFGPPRGMMPGLTWFDMECLHHYHFLEKHTLFSRYKTLASILQRDSMSTDEEVDDTKASLIEERRKQCGFS